jgi:hypothetical protein
MQDLALDETSKNAATNVVSVMVNGICSGNNAGSSLDETSKNAATNVVSVMVNGICSGNNAKYRVRQKNLTIFNLK